MCEEVSFRERLGSCAKRLSAADALPEAELRAVVREVHADLVGLDLPQRVLGAAHSAPGLAPPVPVGGFTTFLGQSPLPGLHRAEGGDGEHAVPFPL